MDNQINNSTPPQLKYDIYFGVLLVFLIVVIVILLLLYRKLKQQTLVNGNPSQNIKNTDAQQQSINYQNIELPQEIFENQTLKNFLKISYANLQKGIDAKNTNTNFRFTHNFDKLNIGHRLKACNDDIFQVNLKIINNIDSKSLKCYGQKQAENHLNLFTESTNNENGAKALLIGPNQCGKSYLAKQFSESIKGLSVVVHIDANSFQGEFKTESLAKLINDLYNLIKKSNPNNQRINFVFCIDEFDRKDLLGGFNLHLDYFKNQIFEQIYDDPNKPTWLIPHLVITANNEKRFIQTHSAGNTDANYTFFSRIPNKFIFQRLGLNESISVVSEILDNKNITNNETQIINTISKSLIDIMKKNNENTLTMKEITEVIDNQLLIVNSQLNSMQMTTGSSNKK